MRRMKILAATAATLMMTVAGIANAQQSQPAAKDMPQGLSSTMSGKLDTATLIEVKDNKLMVPGMNLTVGALDDFNVYGSDGKKIGEIDKVLANSSNEIKAVTVEVGGFLGLGSRQVVIALDKLQKGPEAKSLRTAMTKDEIEKLDIWTVRSDTTIRK